jgi:hypothetical protein
MTLVKAASASSVGLGLGLELELARGTMLHCARGGGSR